MLVLTFKNIIGAYGMKNSTKTSFLKRPIMTGGAAIALGLAAFGAGQILSPHNIEAQAIKAQAPKAAVALPSFADLVDRVAPAVVAIEVSQRSKGVSQEELEALPPEFRKFFEGQAGKGRLVKGNGSGFFINANGYIVTNNHVVEDAEKITVTLKDGRDLEAKVIGRDERTDLAVIKVEGNNFQYVQFEPNTNVRVGDWVIAIGNPFNLGGTATAGIVSALGRENVGDRNISDFIQIDAPINPGNSGGPTFDMSGRVIGVNTAIFSKSGGNIGIGFAVPAKIANKVTQDIIKNGQVTYGWIGVTIQDLSREMAESYGLANVKGAIIGQVTPNAPAAKAGLKRGDVVVAFDGKPVMGSTDLTRKIGAISVGDKAKLDVVDGAGKKRVVEITIAARPSEKQLADLQKNLPLDEEKVEKAAIVEVLGLKLGVLGAKDKAKLGLKPDDNGVLITEANADSIAASKGLNAGSAILLVNNQELLNPEQFKAEVAKAKKEGRKFIRIFFISGPGLSRFETLPVE